MTCVELPGLSAIVRHMRAALARDLCTQGRCQECCTCGNSLGRTRLRFSVKPQLREAVPADSQARGILVRGISGSITDKGKHLLLGAAAQRDRRAKYLQPLSLPLCDEGQGVAELFKADPH